MTKTNAPNALIHETSPYLLQHAYNPVQWYPWGEEALQLAKDKGLPILVSIGYSACHWCHVMERESFEDAETAAFMNAHFINIKIDREERPDLDHIYMDAVQAITGSGGWPLNVFLTPDTKPFYGGTYYPPQKAFNRPSWLDVLYSMSEYWKNKRAEVEEQANGLMEHLEKSNRFSFKANLSAATNDFYAMDKCRLIADNLLTNADKTEGGFGKAPKFLQTASIQYLLQYAHLSGNAEYSGQPLLSLSKMVKGGIYDQLGGGISRYSTDNEWLVPHFEKMLYDNALLVTALCDAYQFTRDDFYAEAIRSTLDFVTGELQDKEGGYYTALDADSEGVEGKFYVWEKAEIEEILGKDAPVFCAYYNVTDKGNWEEKNILNIQTGTGSFAKTWQMGEDLLKDLLKDCRQKLLRQRNGRIPPGLDDKQLLNCNALLLTAFCRAAGCLGADGYKQRAIQLAAFIEAKFAGPAGGLLHTYKAGKARFPAFLDDYAYYIQALQALQELTGNQHYLLLARKYTQQVLDHYSDDEDTLFYYTHAGQPDIIVRKAEVYDGATPSANAIMAQNLFYLSVVFDEPAWRNRAAKMLGSIYPAIEKYPGSFAVWAGIYLRQAAGVKEIALMGKGLEAVLAGILKEFIPHKILQSSIDAASGEWPMFGGKQADGPPAIYVCSNYSCLLPVFTVKELVKTIKNNPVDDATHNNK